MTKNLMDEFTLNKNEYEEYFVPLLQEINFNAKRIIQFGIMLPFFLRIPPLERYTSFSANEFLKSFSFLHFEYEQPLFCGMINPINELASNNKVGVTRVEMTYIDENVDIEMTQDALSNIFNMLLKDLNMILDAYELEVRNGFVYNLSREMFEPMCIWRAIDNEWETNKNGMFILHHRANTGLRENFLNGTHLRNIGNNFGLIGANVNPFVLSELLVNVSRRMMTQGQYKEAVIFIQTSIEIFLSNLLIEFLKHEGEKDEESKNKVSELPFLSIIKKEMAIRLGGSWDITKIGSELNIWYEKTYRIRNKIIHSGYQPTFDEVNEAMHSAGNFQKFILTQLKKRKSVYPNIVRYFSNI